MLSHVITIKLTKNWKTTLGILATGGVVIGFSYWLWIRWTASGDQPSVTASYSLNEPTADMNTFPRVHRTLRQQLTGSGSSRTSVTGRLSSVFRQKPPATAALTHDSDADDDGSSSNLDWGRLGLRALAAVVEHLETLMSRIRVYEERGQMQMSDESGQLISELRLLLEQAYHLREQYRRKLILQDQDYTTEAVDSEFSIDDDTCSYFSALEQIDLSELEIEISRNLLRPIYREALELLDKSEIPYRSLRTQLVGCERDFEYLAKLHCLRQAFDYIFQQPEPTDWLCSVGKLTGFRLLHCLGYPTSDFEEAYERLISFVNTQRHELKSTMSEELFAKGVKMVNFYDVVIDLMLLEALELLADPPASVLSVTRHRWLSDNFKKVALDSTIWTILLAKRKLLKYTDGFYAHYYTLVGTITPALAWGFLGPDEGALRLCNRFRDAINAFLQEAFTCSDEYGAERARREVTPTDTMHETLQDTLNGYSYSVDGLTEEQTEPGQSDEVLREDTDDGDDQSTIIYQAPLISDVVNHASTPSSKSVRTGLRYTVVSELADDLFNLFVSYINGLTRMFREEARIAKRPLPDEYLANPAPPPLRIF
ncbi:Mitoguardin [Clonorchis sinensis]|uniref:Mitoguardin n=2 Tax=Clonorchis sinensis TaxID=79923 RepID=A0A8T1MQ65_CLOSI|nr:Mitoguardin [Clonorchis sinensis]GAA50109.1 protein FAM73B [Clonorchis sinensis]